MRESAVHTPMRSPRMRRAGWPSTTTETSNDVPPMSQVMRWSMPVAAPTSTDAATPAAGPESARPSGWRRASATVIDPPAELTSSSGTGSPRRASSASRSSMPPSAPDTYAFNTVWVVRSYSRIVGWRSDPATTARSGATSRTAITDAASCAGFTNDHRYEIAMASTEWSSSMRVTAAVTVVGSSGTTTLPSRSMRSSIPTMACGTTIGGGGTSQPSASATRVPAPVAPAPRSPS
jgi:hypothetical protein